MRFFVGIVFAACCFWTPSFAAENTLPPALWQNLPDCSMGCLLQFYPRYCGTFQGDTTCYCSDMRLREETTPCVANACNITENIRWERYSATTCGTPNDQSRVQSQRYTYYVLPVLTAVFVAARLWSKYVFGVLDWDDVAMVAALLFYCGIAAAGLIMAKNGSGSHTYWLDVQQTINSARLYWVSSIFHVLAITMTKLSLLLFFLQIFTTRRHPRWIYLIMGFIIISNLSFLISLLLLCTPTHGIWTNWMYKEPPIKCLNGFALDYVQSSFSILHNIMILVFPVPILWKLELTWRKRANLIAMFSVASFVLIASFIRLPTMIEVQYSHDPSFDQAPAALWTNLETAVGIICACLPATRSLVGYYFPNMKLTFLSTDDSRSPSRRTPGNTLHGKETQAKSPGSTLKNTNLRYHNRISLDSDIEFDTRDEIPSQSRGRGASVQSNDSASPINESKQREGSLVLPRSQCVLGKKFGTSSQVVVDKPPQGRWVHEGVIVSTTIERRESRSGDLAYHL